VFIIKYQYNMYTILLGTLLVGEAVALFIGMHVLSKKHNSWISNKNSLLLILDIGCGTMLLISVLVKIPEVFFWLIFIMVVLSHSFREYEYLSLQKQPFCSNLPLFIANNVKMVLSLSTAVIHLTFI
jgi:hypothetical protein